MVWLSRRYAPLLVHADVSSPVVRDSAKDSPQDSLGRLDVTCCGKDRISLLIELLAFVLSTALVVYLYFPLLMPLIDDRLEFVYGDFTTIINVNSDAVIISQEFYNYIYNGRMGTFNVESRLALKYSIASFLPSDSQRISFLILISLLLGTVGIYLIIKQFVRDSRHRSLLLLAFIPFYFLNLWSAERLGHTWIWFTYAVFPLFVALGIRYFSGRLYSIFYWLLFAFFGVIPHSFLYMLILHIYLSIFNYINNKDIKRSTEFFLLPITIYVILNLFFILPYFIYSGINYPVTITLDILIILSRYGELINLFTFSNNWWPQVDPNQIFNNIYFRLSSLAISTLALLVPLCSVIKLKGKDRIILILTLLLSLIIMGVAQGPHNYFLLQLLHILGEHGMLNLVGPFREWARISILLPILYILAMAIGFSGLTKKEKNIVVLLLNIFIYMNVIFSPSLTYITKIYAPVYVPEEYYELSKAIGNIHKTLWIHPTNAYNILGMWRYSWNENKAISPVLEYSIGPTYPNGIEIIKLIKERETPLNLLNALNIRYVIKRTDILGASEFKVNYSWLNCTKYTYLAVCVNRDATGPFSVYDTGVFAYDDLEKLLSLAKYSSIPTTSTWDNRLGYVLFDGLLSHTLYFLVMNRSAIVIQPVLFSYRYNPAQVWSKAWTTDPLHAEWHPYLSALGIENWQTDFGLGLVFTTAEGASLPIKFQVKRTDGYHVFVRLFENQKGGQLQISIDDKVITINTTNQLNRFVWKYLGYFNFEEGSHTITLKNIKGLNAVNIIVLATDWQLKEAEAEVEKYLINRTIIYIFAVNDLYYKYGEVKEGLLSLWPNGIAWQTVEIPKEGSYVIALHSRGVFEVRLGNYTYLVNSTTLQLNYLGPLSLDKGIYRLELHPLTNNTCLIESVWIYSSDGRTPDLYTLLRTERPAEIENYTKLDPTRWEVYIRAQKPFLLTFAETYDPNWKAYIYKNGTLVEESSPIPLYGAINGFWINATGNLRVVIIYTLQNLFELGWCISISTIIMILAYSIYAIIKIYILSSTRLKP